MYTNIKTTFGKFSTMIFFELLVRKKMHTILRTTFGKNLTMIFYDYINLNMFTHHYMKIKKRKEKKKEKKKTFCVTTDDIHPYDIFSAFITNSHYLSPLGKWTGCPPVTTTCYVICSTYSTRLMPTIRYSIFLHTCTCPSSTTIWRIRIILPDPDPTIGF